MTNLTSQKLKKDTILEPRMLYHEMVHVQLLQTANEIGLLKRAVLRMTSALVASCTVVWVIMGAVYFAIFCATGDNCKTYCSHLGVHCPAEELHYHAMCLNYSQEGTASELQEEWGAVHVEDITNATFANQSQGKLRLLLEMSYNTTVFIFDTKNTTVVSPVTLFYDLDVNVTAIKHAERCFLDLVVMPPALQVMRALLRGAAPPPPGVRPVRPRARLPRLLRAQRRDT